MISIRYARIRAQATGVLLIAVAIAQPARAQSMAAGSGAISNTAFNPAISLILNGQFASYSSSAASRDVPGFQLGGEAVSFTRGFALRESELNLSANIDDKFYAASTISFDSDAGETTVEVEEVYFETLTMQAGLRVKAGRFYSGVGYVNGIHSHTTSFSDDSLPYAVLFGGRLADSGIQLTWTPPTLLYIQLGGELLAGNSFPSAGAAKSGVGTRTLLARFGGDLGDSNSWLAGLSYVASHAVERGNGGTAGETGIDPLFTGTSDTWIASAVWKWAPNGNTRDRNFRFTAEVLSRNEKGELLLDPESGTLHARQKGYYAEAVYRFRPQWSVGLRVDGLVSDTSIKGITAPIILGDDSFRPRRITAMVDFSNSEFSTLRLQYTRDQSTREGDRQVVLQYIMSMGAHGAHSF